MVITRFTWLLVAFVLVLPIACGNDDGDPIASSGGAPLANEAPVPELVCPAYDANAFPEMAPAVVEKASFSLPLVGAFTVSSNGSPSYSIALQIPPARFAPSVGLVINSGGISVSGLSSISRCGANLAQDGEIRGVSLTSNDNYCFNGARLIQINTGKDSVGHFAEYRTWPDSNTKFLGYGAAAADGFDVTYFVALSPNGTISHYGKSQNARVLWRGVTRTWNLEREMDRRGNTISYDYENQTQGAKDFTTRETVIDQIVYTGFIDDNGVETLGDQVIDFQYETDDRHGKIFYEGEDVANTKRLSKIVTQSNGANVRSYRVAYEVVQKIDVQES